MKPLFADTSYFIAMLNERDIHHAVADKFARDFTGLILTTDWVLLELANYFSNSKQRAVAAAMIESILVDPKSECVEASRDSLLGGLALYHSRHDKAWSLTDCISIQLMQDRAVLEVLSSDHHFEQAGFAILLK
jgi:uncharacterized protein